MPNKVRFGLKNVYYAVATIAADGSATYGAPKHIAGAVSLTLDPNGDITRFRADNINYWISSANNGYTGSLEMAVLTDDFRKDCLGEFVDNKGVLIEKVGNGNVPHFALMYEFDGDAEPTRHVLYNITASRPSGGGQTTGETVEPETETFDFEAGSIFVDDLDEDIVKARVRKSDDSATYEGWNSAVYVPSALPTP